MTIAVNREPGMTWLVWLQEEYAAGRLALPEYEGLVMAAVELGDPLYAPWPGGLNPEPEPPLLEQLTSSG